MPTPRLLLADDHTMILEGLRRVLEPEFEIAGFAANGRDLVDQARLLKPDVVVLDIAMPLLNGIEAARQIKTAWPATKLVFLTQMADRGYVYAAFQAQASAYLLKQSAVCELQVAVREALAGRFYVSPLVCKGTSDAMLNPSHNPAELFSGDLTARQREVLQLVAEGKTGKEIAAILAISTKTVEFHKSAIMQELGLRTTAEHRHGGAVLARRIAQPRE
jgi:DNA-binding NarL/FixJ family response regulator